MAREKCWTLENTIVFFQLVKEYRDRTGVLPLHDSVWLNTTASIIGAGVSPTGVKYKLYQYQSGRTLSPDYPDPGVFQEVHTNRAIAFTVGLLTEQEYLDLIREDHRKVEHDLPQVR